MFGNRFHVSPRAARILTAVGLTAVLAAGCAGQGGSQVGSSVGGHAHSYATSQNGVNNLTSVATTVDKCVSATQGKKHKFLRALKCVKGQYNLGFYALLKCGNKVLKRLGYTLSIFVSNNQPEEKAYWARFSRTCVFTANNPAGVTQYGTPSPSPSHS